MKTERVSSIINALVRDWCLWSVLYSKLDEAIDIKKKKKVCEKLEALNERISKRVSKLDEVFNAVC